MIHFIIFYHSKNIQLEKERIEQEEMLKARKRRQNNKNFNNNNNNYYNENDSDEDKNKSISKRKNLFVANNKKPKALANKFLFGLTFTVGVAAVAMYAINTNVREPQEIISKVFQLMNYKDI